MTTIRGNQKRLGKQVRKPLRLKIPEFPTPLVGEVYKAIKLNRKTKYSWFADNLGVSEATIKRSIADLRKLGYISPEHSKIKGEGMATAKVIITKKLQERKKHSLLQRCQ